MNRREFGKRISSLFAALALTALLPVSLLTGCDAGSLFAQILAYVGVGLQGFSAIVNLLVGAGVINPVEGSAIAAAIALVNAGFLALQKAVQDYNAAPADQKATLLEKISLAIATLRNDLGSFWDALKISDPKMSALVAGLLEVILSTLAAFAIKLPPAPAQLSRRVAAVQPRERSEKQFKKDFNRLLDEAGYGQYRLR